MILFRSTSSLGHWHRGKDSIAQVTFGVVVEGSVESLLSGTELLIMLTTGTVP